MLKLGGANAVPSTVIAILCSMAVLAIAVTACATRESSPQATDDRSLSPSSLPGGGLRSQKPSAPASIAETLTGQLGFDEIEGGCAYLGTADGTRYQVIYPTGWELHTGPLQLVSPAGETVARLGDTITVRGMPAEAMASTCQIGPIFRVSEVQVP